jgi:rhodanese-related sulfurtransferase
MSNRRTHAQSRTSRKTLRRRSGLSKRAGMIAAILVLVLIVAVIFAFNQKQNKEVLPVEIGADQAYQYYKEGYFFLDVREQEEWDTFHIPATTLIPLGELPDRLSELPRNQPIVVVCRSGNRSQEGRNILLDAGFTNITSMAGGVTEWSRLGYPIEGTRP